jgi:hypothetical protein
MDGVGGFDPKHPNKSTNYIYLIGNEKLSADLLEVSRSANDRLREGKLELT